MEPCACLYMQHLDEGRDCTAEYQTRFEGCDRAVTDRYGMRSALVSRVESSHKFTSNPYFPPSDVQRIWNSIHSELKDWAGKTASWENIVTAR